MISRWYDGLTKREQVLLVLTVMAVTLAAWYQVVWIPFSRALSEVESRLANGAERASPVVHQALLPWRLHAKQWVPPEEVVLLLDRLTQGETRGGLRLVGMAVQPARLLFSCEKMVTSDGASRLFRHELTLTLEGGYPALLTYLYQLEDMPWKIYLDHLDDTITHPSQAILSIGLHFFSVSPSLFVE